MRLGPERVTAGMVRALNLGCLSARADVATLRLTGAGAVTCFQGLFTNDIEKAGDGGFIYGALLTAKGMIVVEGWAARVGNQVIYVVPRVGRERVAEIFARSIPPRLAQIEDRTDSTAVLRLAGPRALAVADLANIPLPPAPGRVIDARIGEAESLVARPSELAPFALQIVTTPEAAGPIIDRLARAGATPGEAAGLDLARVLGGWPSLESEIDDKTIPQEVRYDEIGGVSYTKGCYTGQETVSRLHFRGHANRHLRGLLFDADPPGAPAGGTGEPLVIHDDREVGRVTSVAWLPEGTAGSGRWLGLGVLRREVEPGMTIRADGYDAHVVDLPFALPYIAPA